MPTAEYFSEFPPFPDEVDTIELPRISLSKVEAVNSDEIDRLFDACQRVGFILLDLSTSDEGNVLLKETEGVFRMSEELYKTPVEELMKYEYGAPKSLYGYKYKGQTKLEDGRPDNIAFYNIRRDDMLDMTDVRAHPASIEQRRPLLASWFRHTHGIIDTVFGCMERHLRLPGGTLDSLNSIERPSGTHVRLTKSSSSSSSTATGSRGETAGGAATSFLGHTDTGSITMLFNVVGGLQILPPGMANADGNWRYVRPEPGCAIVNVGDALVEWSGGVLRSNMHRVVTPPGDQRSCDRYSVACLVRPDEKASMRRLDSSVIAAAAGATQDGGEHGEFNINAKDWEETRIAGIIAGKGVYTSSGGRLLKMADVTVGG